MMKMHGRPGGWTLLAALLSCSAAGAESGGKVIYGPDDRVDYYAAPPAWRTRADSTVAVFKGDKVGPDGTLALESFARRHRLCAGQRFAEQPSGSYCSGSLVAPDIVLTAGHCLHMPTDRSRDTDVPECSNMKFVFGYALKRPGGTPARVDPGDVYRCAGVVARDYPGTGSRAADYALIRLDRPVKGRAPLALERGKEVSAGDAVTVIGTPSGLPTKVAGGAKVRDASDPWFFVADLDSFGGNSGSAVFSSESGLVVGIVVRGETDFRQGDSGDCNVYNIKPQDGGRGEDVIRVSRILAQLDAAAPPPSGLRLRALGEGLLSRMRAMVGSLTGGR